MIKKDMKRYLEEKCNDFYKPITECSKSDNDFILVESEKKIYSFDSITKSLYNGQKCPTSVDGISINKKTVNLIEFKSGFKQKITKSNFNKETGKCEHLNGVCEDYWALFFRNQKKNIDELINSIRFKSIESYITLEKHVFLKCENLDNDKNMALKLIVVIDEDGIESMEETLLDLSSENNNQNNVFIKIRDSLRRITNLKDACNNYYYYDSIEVMSHHEFKIKYCNS